MCSVKKIFLRISQNSQENTSARVSFLIKLQAPPATLLKKRLLNRCFPVNFAKFLTTLFFNNTHLRVLRWISPEGSTLGSPLRVSPQGLNLGSHPRVPPQGPTLGSYLSIPCKHFTLVSHPSFHPSIRPKGPGLRVPSQDSKFHFSGIPSSLQPYQKRDSSSGISL